MSRFLQQISKFKLHVFEAVKQIAVADRRLMPVMLDSFNWSYQVILATAVFVAAKLGILNQHMMFS